MRLYLLAVGRLRPYYREACDDYRRRLRRFAEIEEIEVKEASHADGSDRQQSIEADRLVQRLPKHVTLIALAREGRTWTSDGLAQQIESWTGTGVPMAFALGGSHGLHPSVVDRAHAVWSLGPMTLPHELARVVVYEQVYRGYTILNRMPYHKGKKGEGSRNA